MKRLFTILLITLLSTTIWAQKSQQSKDHQDLVWHTNLPYALEDFF
jgi:hypothetical protein